MIINLMMPYAESNDISYLLAHQIPAVDTSQQHTLDIVQQTVTFQSLFIMHVSRKKQ